MKKTYSTGFSLLELVIYMAIFSAIITTTSVSLFSFSTIIKTYADTAHIEEYGNYILQTIYIDLANGKSAVIPSSTPEFEIVDPKVAHASLPGGRMKTEVSFSIKNHVFTLIYVPN
ncbi:MAG: prepilin-type N-terminal cleavage/methylation domain-containing protein [bacterium]|nr:prepilin-type N-terminal cleavage/methylation domain-containing protein [bacterium]